MADGRGRVVPRVLPTVVPNEIPYVPGLWDMGNLDLTSHFFASRRGEAFRVWDVLWPWVERQLCCLGTSGRDRGVGWAEESARPGPPWVSRWLTGPLRSVRPGVDLNLDGLAFLHRDGSLGAQLLAGREVFSGPDEKSSQSPPTTLPLLSSKRTAESISAVATSSDAARTAVTS